MRWIEPAYFFAVYATSVGATYATITFALVGIPDFLRDLFEVTQAKYSVSKLGDVDVDKRLEQLEALMHNDRLYQQDDISLATVADALEVTSHQLSELINTQLGIGFSRYVRSKRLDAACKLLRANPDQSVLSIALEVGFRSQSTFYAAFKSNFQQSPSEYRAGR